MIFTTAIAFALLSSFSKPMSASSPRFLGLIMILVLIRSATAHSGNSFYFLSSVYSYQIVSESLGIIVAAVLPSVQISIAICLILRWRLRSTYCFLAFLFVVFIAVQSSAISRDLHISCGCFVAGESLPVGPQTIAFSVFCAIASTVGFFISPAKPIE